MTSLKSEEELLLTRMMRSGRRFRASQKRGVEEEEEDEDEDEERAISKHLMRLAGENCWGMKATTKRRLEATWRASLSPSLSLEVRRGASKSTLQKVMMSSATCTHEAGGMNMTTFLRINDILRIGSITNMSFC